MAASRSARVTARDYLRTKLGDRRGFRQLIGALDDDDPAIFREIEIELAEVLEAFKEADHGRE